MQIPYRDPKTRKNYWFTRSETQKATRLEVPPIWKQDFASKQITCVEYRNLSHGFERDIFQRVQLGMPLTAAEKLQAIPSPWSEWISDLDTRYINNDDGITDIVDVDMKRGRDFQSLAQLVYCCDAYPEHAIPTAQKMEQWLVRMDLPNPAFKTAVNDVLTEFWYIAHTPRLAQAFTKIQKRVAPVEFVFIGVVLFALRDASHETRAEEIYNMRVHIRNRFSDVRFRNDVVRMLWDFIEDVVARQEVNESRSRRDSGDTNDKKKRKKKKDDSDDEMVDDYHPSNSQATRRSKGKGVR
ncbi:hypothetical protein AcV5_003610 [Taiwanofungus camphoratus]|nr:hypothetical protein AcV5_003610 [Antrodia cinnamomea]KAI0958289.1 hypothetical protein AcV7_004147 [Antrodia cinnamomea]